MRHLSFFIGKLNVIPKMQGRKTRSMAVIQCQFDYACSLWYSGLNKALKKVDIMQNKIIRFIHGFEYRKKSRLSHFFIDWFSKC